MAAGRGAWRKVLQPGTSGAWLRGQESALQRWTVWAIVCTSMGMFGCWRQSIAAISAVVLLCAACSGSSTSTPPAAASFGDGPSAGVAAAGHGEVGSAAPGGAAAGASGEGQADTRDAAVASDPNAAVFDRTSWSAYPAVQFPPENPFSPEKAVLGKALFWDEQLSSDNTVACGTCHRPAAGGSDPRPAQPGYLGNPGADGTRGTADDPKGSPGIAACMTTGDGAPTDLDDGVFGHLPQVGRRRAMTVLDAMFWDSMFWDGRVKAALIDPQTNELVIERGAALEAQALMPVLNPVEMSCQGRDWDMVTSKLSRAKPLALASDLPSDLLDAQLSAAAYPDLFANAFGDGAVTSTRIAMAIATYERTLVADKTPWDRWLAGDDQAMSPQQKRGFQVFARKGQCACCHTAPLFGLPALVDDAFHEISWDGGGAELGLDKPGAYKNPTFRTVTARNAGLREAAGLLHDGVAPGDSLEALIAAYNKKPVRNVHFCRIELNLSEDEQADLVEFVRHGLTDPRAEREQAPFDRPKLSSEAPP